MTHEHKPTVLHVRGVTGAGGGPEKTILNSPRYLREFGYRALCAYMHAPDDPGFRDLQRRAEAAEAPLVSIADRGPLDWKIIQQLIDLCRREQVDVWHGHDYKSNLFGLIVRRFVPLRLVTTVHGWVQMTARTRWYHKIDKLCLRHYEEVFCVSEDLVDACRAAGVPAARCHFIPNAIDTETYRRRRTPQEARTGFADPAEGLLIGALGRLSDEKGFDLLIRAVTQLIESGENVTLWIGGDGPRRAALAELIRTSDQQDRIRLLGHVERPIEFFEALDLFVLSSRREGLPNVVLEAMALETPLVATNVAGVPRLVVDRETGLLVAAGEVEQLVRGIRAMLHDERLRDECRAAARTLIETEYGFQQRMEKIVCHYDRLLGRPPRPAETAAECSV